MRAITLAASLFMAGSAFAGPDIIAYTPSHSSGRTATYTYINAHVIKVSPSARTITFRSESRNVVLTVEGDALNGLGRLRAGDDVLLGYRMGTRAGRSVRIVNAIMPGDSLRFASTTRGTVTTFPVMTPGVAMAPSTPDDSARVVTVPGTGTGPAVAGEPGVTENDFASVNGAVLRNDTTNFTYGPGSPYNREIPQLPGPVVTGGVVIPPAVAPTLSPTLPVGAVRDVATRDYENTVRALAARANQIDGSWTRYRDLCLGTAGAASSTATNVEASGRDRGWFAVLDNSLPVPTEDQCRQLLSEMTTVANDWRDQMAGAESAARTYDVLPGQMRDVRQRYRVDF